MEISTKLLQTVMEIGFMATSNGLAEEAEIIFDGLQNHRTDSEYPLIGMAVNKMNVNQSEEAIRILRDQALPLNPDNDLIRGYLGMAYYVAHREREARTIFDEIIDNNRCEEALTMAHKLLNDWNQTAAVR